MKTTSRFLAASFSAVLLLGAVCPQAIAGGLLTSPDAQEIETPPPVVEQKPATPEPDVKVDKKKKKSVKSSGEPASKSDDGAAANAKAKKAAKKKKPKEQATDAAAATDGADAAKKADAEKEKANRKKAKKDKKKAEPATAKDGNADSQKAEDTDPKKGDETEKTNSPDTSGSGTQKAKSTVPLPTRLASFTTGAILGYPFAFAKRTIHQTKAGNRDFIGSSSNPFKVVPATIVSLPFGFVGGLFEGVEYSVVNSWKGSGEEPFGKESFSRGDDQN